jgi:hypothetical protein
MMAKATSRMVRSIYWRASITNLLWPKTEEKRWICTVKQLIETAYRMMSPFPWITIMFRILRDGLERGHFYYWMMLYQKIAQWRIIMYCKPVTLEEDV